MADEIEVEEVNEGTQSGRKRCCDECGKEYTFKSLKSKFCSDRCRATFGLKKRGAKLNGTENANTTAMEEPEVLDHDHDDIDDRQGNDKSVSVTKLTGSLRGLDAQSQYIITHQREMIQDLKERRRNLEQKLEKVTERKNELEKKLDKMDLEQSLNIQAKSGLNGISENPLVHKLVELAGPGISAWFQNLVTKQAGVGQLAGGEELSPEVQKQLQAIAGWYSVQLPEVQQSVFNILDELANQEDPKKLELLLKRVTTVLKNGTANQNGYHQSIFPN